MNNELIRRDPFGASYKAAGGALVGVARIEQLLQWQIEMSMPKLTKKLSARIFTGFGPLSSYSAKIDVAVAMGILDADLAKDLHVFRQIRNAFAHSTTEIHYDDEPVLSLMSKLPLAQEQDWSLELWFVKNLMNCTLRLLSRFDVVEEGMGVRPPSMGSNDG